MAKEVTIPKKILTAEFKRECAELVLVHGYKHKDAAEAMGMVWPA